MSDPDYDHDDMREETWPKKCGCGVEYTEDQWEALRYVGVQKSAFISIADLEMRNCSSCNSTLAITAPKIYPGK